MIKQDISVKRALEMVHAVRDVIAPLDNRLLFPLYASRQVVALVLTEAGITVGGRLAQEALDVDLRPTDSPFPPKEPTPHVPPGG